MHARTWRTCARASTMYLDVGSCTYVYNNRVFVRCQPYCTARQVAVASQIVEARASFQMESFVRGHHVYFTSWTPTVIEVLPVKHEVLSKYDHFTVAMWKDEEVVGHVPRAKRKTTFF